MKEMEQMKSQIKQLTKEKDDYRKRFMLAKRELDKFKHIADTTDKIRQNQQALINLQ